jgi:hypothetical protein
MPNKPALFLLVAAALAAGLINEYLPGSIAPPKAWFPLRHADYKIARKVADSLLVVYLLDKRAKKNTIANRLEGETYVKKELAEAMCGSRIGEMGAVFLKGKLLGEVALAAFHLNWCDFYGAMIETEYIPPNPFKIDRYFPGAMFVYGPMYRSVKPHTLKRIKAAEKPLKKFLLNLDPPPFEFISDLEITAYKYGKSGNRFLALVNFSATSKFSPGALYLMEEAEADSFSVLGAYFIGEKAKIIQAVVEKGDPDPIIQVGAFGGGTEYIIVQYGRGGFREVYKRKKGEFP